MLHQPILPANRTSDNNVAAGLLAADTVYWAEAGNGVVTAYHSESQSLDQHTAEQNLAFGDGHAESRPENYYSKPLSNNDASLIPNYPAAPGNVFYWEGSPK
jgi:hypothetical protein